MTNFQLLDSQLHQKLRIRPFIDDIPPLIRIAVGEIADASVSCPVMFTKESDTGKFYAGALLSLKQGERPLKSVDDRGGFVPLALQCGGFRVSGDHIVIDRDNPRFSESDGELLFTESGQPADCLRKVQVALGKYQAGLNATEAFIGSLLELKLIEPVDIALKFDSGERLELHNLYTVSLDSLRDIDDAAAIRLFRSGYLELAYTVATSMKQFSVLAALRNRLVKASRSNSNANGKQLADSHR